MREILFKAKTKLIATTYNYGKPDGEWVKGYLYNDVGCWKIKQFEQSVSNYIDYEIDPETICQYTGCTDKNDKKIFENDICRNNVDYHIYKVAYWEHDGCFMYEDQNEESNGYNLCEFDDIKVIGNIFDNPELLK